MLKQKQFFVDKMIDLYRNPLFGDKALEADVDRTRAILQRRLLDNSEVGLRGLDFTTSEEVSSLEGNVGIRALPKSVGIDSIRHILSQYGIAEGAKVVNAFLAPDLNKRAADFAHKIYLNQARAALVEILRKADPFLLPSVIAEDLYELKPRKDKTQKIDFPIKHPLIFLIFSDPLKFDGGDATEQLRAVLMGTNQNANPDYTLVRGKFQVGLPDRSYPDNFFFSLFYENQKADDLPDNFNLSRGSMNDLDSLVLAGQNVDKEDGSLHNLPLCPDFRKVCGLYRNMLDLLNSGNVAVKSGIVAEREVMYLDIDNTHLPQNEERKGVRREVVPTHFQRYWIGPRTDSSEVIYTVKAYIRGSEPWKNVEHRIRGEKLSRPLDPLDYHI